MTFESMKMNRRKWLLSSGAAAVTAAGGSPIFGSAASPLENRSTPRKSPRAIKFLFFDPWTLEYVRGFQRRLVQPTKYSGNPIFKPERPYEFSRVHLYGTVLRDPGSGLFKMWYSTHDPKDQGGPYLCYATSKGGYVWDRPELDIVSGTNIVFDKQENTHGPSVLFDPEDPDASRRYKLMMRPGKTPAIVAYFSSDGIHWRKAQAEPVIRANSDCHIGLYRDPKTGLYQSSYRTDAPDRRVWRSESEDFLHWTRPLLAIEPDAGDPAQTQFYGMQMTPYGNYVMGWLSMYNTWETDFKWSKMDGTMDLDLAYSRDGYCWHRLGQGTRFIPLGEEGSWDGQMLIPSTTPIFLENEIRFYYAGTPHQHRPPYINIGNECIGAASLRPDGFLALQVGEEWAELLTRPFAIHEAAILINADASRGQIRVEICDESGQPIEGFRFKDCKPIQADGTALPVQWTSAGDPSKVVRKPIRLRVRAHRADLYSVSLPNGNASPRYWEFREIRCLNPMRDLEDV